MVFSPPELEALTRVKGIFDPEGTFNPGKVLPDPDEGGAS
jgi:FAD/FMN-containing dehydrogenase